ncbi:hypothetical protein [Amphritea japonica]|uniref:Uncharacterized protein n=1 Tax=Amphritea japonica ATCC BAA-1530 TaxID=1278309 RepID=A0A7R6SSJ5_9GAMM|nr:hypothetical protein [Amphritea japonica]BBB26399.1 hypothetical protein AMJAP_1805 [Amphritea japonica ATCC BAA-1530]
MSFINEYVTEADIEKYGLFDVKCSAKPSLIKRGLPSGFKYHWTVDKERNIYLMLLGIGKEEFSNRFKWVLNIDGMEIVFETDKSSKGSGNIYDRPYLVIWDLIAGNKNNYLNSMNEDEFNILKEAIECFGCFGIVNELDDVVVQLIR